MRLINAATVPRAEKVLRRGICDPSLLVGDCVVIDGPKVGPHVVVDLADPLAASYRPAAGIVTRKYSSTLCLVQFFGPMAGVYSGLTPGAPYFVGVDGRLTATPPTSPAVVQQIGIATDSGELLVNPEGEGGAGGSVSDFDVDRILVLRWNPHDPPVHEEPSVCILASTGNVMVVRP